MSALSKAELADFISDVIGLSKREAKDLVECFFEEISTALINGTDVRLSGFGNFTTRDKSPRPGRNPKTGEEIPITARRVVTFRAGQKLRHRVDAVIEGSELDVDWMNAEDHDDD
ncbi:MAG: integration host factor subunit alpha [Litorivicinus sp.]